MTGRTATAERDGALVKRAAAGDIAAFEALVEPRLSRVFRTACSILGNDADAADVVQEAFVAAWRHLPAIRDGAKFDAWLNKVLLNRCRDLLRRRRRSREVVLGDELEPQYADSTNAVGDAAAVSAAFDLLSAEHRYLLVMHHLHRMSVADLAKQLGIPEGTAKWRLHSARSALERALEVSNG